MAYWRKFLVRDKSKSAVSVKETVLLWWSWGESNPRPKDDPQEHLRAQYAICFSSGADRIRSASPRSSGSPLPRRGRRNRDSPY